MCNSEQADEAFFSYQVKRVKSELSRLIFDDASDQLCDLFNSQPIETLTSATSLLQLPPLHTLQAIRPLRWLAFYGLHSAQESARSVVSSLSSL